MNYFHSLLRRSLFLLAASAFSITTASAEDVGGRWGTEEREREYYPIVNIPIPQDMVIEAGAFCLLPDGRVAVGTRYGEIYILSGIDEKKPNPSYHLFATGLDEIFGLAYKDNAFYVTQSCELTRVSDTKHKGKADRFETISDAWGYANYHEYAFGSKFDREGNLYVALGLSYSYESHALFRGFAMKITPEGKTLALASGLRSPAGIGPNEHGALFYIESQGPWNCSCSLKAVTPGSFHGHPASFNWYKYAPELGPLPVMPKSGSRIIDEKARVKQLTPYAVIFPYVRMGRSITAFEVDRTKGKFGPFEDQIFLGDYTLSIIMRATTEQVNGVWQGACYPFREGLSTGILNVVFTPGGNLMCGGTNRGWPVRGSKPFALERLDWSGKMPFEIKRINIEPNGFKIAFTKPVDARTGSDPSSYQITTFTHPYHGGYGGPEIEQTTPVIKSVKVSEDGMFATLVLNNLIRGHVYDFDLGKLRARDREELLHRKAYYTVNEVPDKPAQPKLKPEPPKPTTHTIKKIEGWNVRVDDRLLNAPDDELGTRVLRTLESKLSDIKSVVPADKLKKLQTVTIVLDLSHGKLDGMQYHPDTGWLKANGYSTDLVKCVHIPRAAELLTKMIVNEQPWVILHELAHAYHDQVLGFEEPRIKDAYEKYKKSGHGEKVLLFNGNRVKHYALTDHKEFFAEMTESYYGVNDFFPFNRAELKEAEPEIYELMKQIWESQPKKDKP